MGLDLIAPDLEIAPEALSATSLALPANYVEGCQRLIGAPLSAWRTWATPRAELAVVVRLATLEATAAFLGCAARAGWTWLPDRSRRITTATESFPALVFRAATDLAHTPPDEEIATWCARVDAFDTAAALVAYLSLAPEAISHDDEWVDGGMIRVETGFAKDGRHYRYFVGAGGFRALEFI